MPDRLGHPLEKPLFDQLTLIGVGLIARGAELKQTDDHVLALRKVKSGEPFVYFAGAGWSKGGFADSAAWQELAGL